MALTTLKKFPLLNHGRLPLQPSLVQLALSLQVALFSSRRLDVLPWHKAAIPVLVKNFKLSNGVHRLPEPVLVVSCLQIVLGQIYQGPILAGATDFEVFEEGIIGHHISDIHYFLTFWLL